MLPEPVRLKLVALGAEALSMLPAGEVPPSLRPVARFAAAKRARLGASAIAAAIDDDPGFRMRVLEVIVRRQPELANRSGVAGPPAAADPVDVAVIAYLERPDGWREQLDAAVGAVEESADRERSDREAQAVVRVREQLDAARSSAREARDRFKGEIARLKDENTALRRKLQQSRQQLADARAAEEAARSGESTVVEQAQAAQRAAEAETRRLRSRLSTAEEAAAAARRSGRADRDLGTARLALLLDALADAAGGLRRELALPASTLRPADTVESAREPVSVAPARPGAGRSTSDPGLLTDLLTLPQVHLVVDGYNVTKSAWPATPLEAQRTRLVQGLSAVAARSGAEITCVFDGADVSTPPAVGAAHGVRVRFSAPRQTADDLIADLVAAEPQGRAVVVVSSDREIARSVQRPGVWTVESAALIGALRT